MWDTSWTVLLSVGGYALAVVAFFKEWLSVRKLELEIAALRRAAKEQSVVLIATPDEVERYGKKIRTSSPMFPIVTILLGSLAAFVTATHITKKDDEVAIAAQMIAERNAKAEIDRLQHQLDETRTALASAIEAASAPNPAQGPRRIDPRFGADNQWRNKPEDRDEYLQKITAEEAAEMRSCSPARHGTFSLYEHSFEVACDATCTHVYVTNRRIDKEKRTISFNYQCFKEK